MSDAHAFARLGTPPGNDDPAGQLQWLIRCVDSFAEKNDPRVQPLRDKLFLTLGELKPSMSDDEKALLNARLHAVQIETFEVITVVINQIRATLRVQLARGMAKTQALESAASCSAS